MLVVAEQHLVERVGLSDEAGHDRGGVVAGSLEIDREVGEARIEALEPGARRGPRQDGQLVDRAAQRDPDDAREDVGRGPRRQLLGPQPCQLGVGAKVCPAPLDEREGVAGARPRAQD